MEVEWAVPSGATCKNLWPIMACSSSQSLSSATEPDSESAAQSAALSLLDKLHPPKTSWVESGKYRRLPRGSKSDPKSATPSQRVMLLHVLDIICGCEHNGFSFEHNDFVIKHNVIKNGELWNNNETIFKHNVQVPTQHKLRQNFLGHARRH